MAYLHSVFVGLTVFVCVSVSFAQEAKTQDSKYTIPVLFDFKNSVAKAEYGFSYELKNAELSFENLGKINDQTFSLKFVTASEAKTVSEKANGGKTFLEVTMPFGFFTEFEIQLINKSGKTILSRSIPKEHIEKTEKAKSLGQIERFIIDDLDKTVAQVRAEKEPVKLCLAQSNGKMFSRLCSRNFGVVERNDNFEVKFDQNKDTTVRALIENETAPLKNKVIAVDKLPVRAYFELQGGVVYELVNQPKIIDFIEVSEEDSKLKFFGAGHLPFGATKKERESISFLNNLFPFDSTIGDFRDFYYLTTTTAHTNPIITTAGHGGGVFQYYLTLKDIPRAADRIYFLDETRNATYQDKYKLYGSSQKKVKFNSSDIVKSATGNDFQWTTSLTKKGEFNTATIDFETEDGNVDRAYFEVYRGFSQEFSLKLTGIKTEKQFVTLGEVSYNKWFEDFGTKPGSLLYQRLGIGLNYFKSFNDIEIDDNGLTSPLEAQSLSLKYRFSPGLWNWDEAWGALLSYQTIKYETLTTPLAGAGVFWARSMPKLFDSVFNLLPIFRYPKWVDMDFVYFPTSLDSKIKSTGSLLVNFHGKILWTKKFYGEAGFGYKAYSLETTEVITEVRSLYLTVGLGLNF